MFVYQAAAFSNDSADHLGQVMLIQNFVFFNQTFIIFDLQTDWNFTRNPSFYIFLNYHLHHLDFRMLPVDLHLETLHYSS